MKDAKIEIFPFGVFLAPLLLNKPVSVVLKSVIAPLNRNAPLNPINPATQINLHRLLLQLMKVAGMIPTTTFGFKEHYWQYSGPSSYNLGGFHGIIVYMRSYADSSKITILSVNTSYSVITFISGRTDLVSDFSITDGNLILSGSGSYWGGIRLAMLGSFL